MRKTPVLLAIFGIAIFCIGFAAAMILRQPNRVDGDVVFAFPAEAHAAGEKRVANQKLIDEFLNLWYSPYQQTVFHHQWLGVKTLQNPNDMWITQEILFEVKPDFFVEAGTYHGGSAAMWAMILEQINPEGRVITIDIEDQVTAAKELDIFKRKVDFLVGSSTSPEIVAEVKRLTAGKKVVVLLDSAHDRDHVLKELELYSPLVGVGSYIIVQDTIVNGHPVWADFGPGPYEAVEAFLAKDPRFHPDRSRERLILTFARNGYLKRIR
jgi:cephalosporin hydroxylase